MRGRTAGWWRASPLGPAGVRVDCVTHGEAVEHVILGVGVNVNVARSALVSTLGPAGRFATSLAALTGRVLDRNAFAAAYLRHLDRWAGIYEARGPAAVVAAWRDREILSGRRVEVRETDRSYEGRVLGLGPGGELVVEDTRGRRRAVTTGEVRLAD